MTPNQKQMLFENICNLELISKSSDITTKNSGDILYFFKNTKLFFSIYLSSDNMKTHDIRWGPNAQEKLLDKIEFDYMDFDDIYCSFETLLNRALEHTK